MRKTLLLAAVLLLSSRYSQAEVLDKCPAFVNTWNDADGVYYLLSANEAILRLVKFSAIYSSIAVLLYFVAQKAKRKWIPYLSMLFTLLIAIFFVTDFVPQDDPCSHYVFLREIPENLYGIQLISEFVLLIVPTVLSLALYRKNRKQTAPLLPQEKK